VQELNANKRRFAQLSSTPSFLSGLARNFRAFFGRKRIGAGASALESTLAAKLDGGGVFVRIDSAVWRLIFDLARENVADQLAELDGIAGACKAFGCHARIIA
jgi:hypothetical protein